MIVTVTLSDVMNDTATAVMAAPIALDLASGSRSRPIRS
jgi:di/tricarboxylate transporter